MGVRTGISLIGRQNHDLPILTAAFPTGGAQKNAPCGEPRGTFRPGPGRVQAAPVGHIDGGQARLSYDRPAGIQRVDQGNLLSHRQVT